MRPHLVKKILTGKGDRAAHVQYYIIHMPSYGEKEHYIQGVSFEYFFHGLKSRNWKNDILYIESILDDFEKESLERMFEIVPEHSELFTDATQVTGIWDFYKLIGYDYKTKKYEL